MTEDAERWKEKYLKSIEQQEKLERRWDARLDLLRRGLVRSTLAAEGSDKVVDECMKEMRDVIRSDNMDAGLAGLIPRLEKAVLDSEQRRETRMNQVSDALTALVGQLQGLPLPSDISRPLKKLAKKLEGGVAQSRELPPLLGELSGLQGRALSALGKPSEEARPGFLQRLFGSREEDAQAGAELAPVALPAAAVVPQAAGSAEPLRHDDVDALQPLPAPAAPTAEVAEAPELELEAFGPALIETAEMPPAPLPRDKAPLPEAEVSASEPLAEAEPLQALEETFGEDGPYALPYAVEPPYSQVAAHIEQTLIGLLDDLSLPERHKAQAQEMRERVARGLNWYELIPVLDDLAVLMLAITDSGQHEFETYLQQLNERLEGFQSHLHEASAGHADNSTAARELDSQLREHVDGLQSSVQGAADVDSLKHILENRLEGLLVTMDEHKHERDRREQELAGRLQGLSERVASMEHEALGYREHLEEQRQKALLDPLTGLPNRAAWSERVEREMLDWQENGGHLAMAILDLDHFKRINDNYGHLAGDKVLKIVADQLRKRLRGRDFIARFGGEEFVLLLPQTTPAVAAQVAEVLRATVEACPFHFKGERVVITTSIGLGAFRSGERSDQVLKRADAALYRAKELGRNRVEHG
ncbi:MULTISPECIES: GGDEF domain-containing protein [Pseudomonas]|uniref:GGDEF domain-containing protein n=1 Tax=Pseudomonas TaxID=286 RepID=UPI000EB21FB2|nr:MULTISPECIES: GGDEF domain-containing protein [Pseudomonas]QNV65278.1 GGDEF domain-containing protein [Pseudomonas sp. CFA]MCX2815679.1 GGDEF domain-containing protein [Pseudomonas sp. DCB_E]MCX9142652.1 GGDEF domain-containing protein [Pseudomonas sp. DCB_Q]MDD2004950.1 GGDEF domain-containing protein [Pseudomonas putida]MDH0709311.1 GGDEF domain-containing protein [Pseudomonas sp. GD03862]